MKGTIRAGLSFAEIVDSGADVLDVTSAAPGPRGSLPLTAEILRDSPSGDIFGLTQNAGMGWDPRELGRCAKATTDNGFYVIYALRQHRPRGAP